MPKVIPFPGVNPGKEIALYTASHIYCGIVVRREPFPDGDGLWLNNVTVLPIKAKVPADEILRLDSVCVLWPHVVALGFAPKRYPEELPE